MSLNLFRAFVALMGALFVVAFCVVVVPAFIASPDLVAAFGGGFVNPFATGYSLDVLFCWCVLALWILYEAKDKHVRFGWIALVVAVVPGVAAGFALYLLLRYRPTPGPL